MKIAKMNLYKVPHHKDCPATVYGVIEIQEGHRNKYEYDPNLENFIYDRSLISSMVYPVNYGFIPQTLCEDGDPIDILVVSKEPIIRGTIIESKVLGVLDMDDNGEKDYKIISVPNFYKDKFSDLDCIDENLIKICTNFFAHYKDLSSSGNRVKLLGWHGKEYAQQIIKERIVK